MKRPDLSAEVGIAEIDDETGLAIEPFRSASDLLSANDADAIAAADAFDFGPDAGRGNADPASSAVEAPGGARSPIERGAPAAEASPSERITVEVHGLTVGRVGAARRAGAHVISGQHVTIHVDAGRITVDGAPIDASDERPAH
jgi:hypothetical protein